MMRATRAALAQHRPQHVDEVRQCPPLVGFSADMRAESLQLKQLLLHALYRHPQVMQTMGVAQQVVRELFAIYLQQPGEMKPDFAARTDTERAVADYIAGMTDRFALREHARLTGQQVLM